MNAHLRLFLSRRYCARRYSDKPLDPGLLLDLPHVAYGCCSTDNGSRHRTVPSAGRIYPMKLYLVLTKEHRLSGELCPGVYAVKFTKEGGYDLVVVRRHENIGEVVASSCVHQSFIAKAPVIVVICADFAKMRRRYHGRGDRFCYMEAGHIGQNIHLFAAAHGLNTVPIGAFSDSGLAKGLKLEYPPVYVFPIGYPPEKP